MKPNILLIMTDQLRADALGCVNGWTRTPNIDRIPAEGTRFNDCVTNSPVCSPARISLATGLYPPTTPASGTTCSLTCPLKPACGRWRRNKKLKALNDTIVIVIEKSSAYKK